MSTTTIYEYTDAAADESIHYRAIYIGAIISLLLGVVSSVMLMVAPSTPEACRYLVFIPAIGICVSFHSWARIRRDSDQYTGAPIAIVGLILSAFFLIAGSAYAVHVYSTEVPVADPPYTRISFEQMRPTEQQERAGKMIPPEIMALDGKRVFIKGYIRPGSSAVRTGIDRFLLVRDNNECCFGDLSKVKYYNQMAVQITSSHRVEDTLRILRMGGILQINPENALLGPEVPVFSLKADYAKQ